MIISHTHKFVFVCLPRTGTTAIRKELCEKYGGEPILYKHASYDVFLRQASAEEKNYKVIASSRNPLDRTVSLYFKYKSDHDSIQSKQIKEVGNKNFIQKGLIALANRLLAKRASAVTGKDLSFQEFFRKFYQQPYSDWHAIYWDRYDYVIRFERLSEDFLAALNTLGIVPVRELPVVNKTKKEGKSFEEYYTPSIIPQAQRVFYHALKQYGYGFPDFWPPYRPGLGDKLRYHTTFQFRKLYWKYIR
ncbi:MAG: sulfotransferase family 2 domain-containing protein [Cyclobacterium sp.]|uniref:sulfotransferase family 2 domain-containing protein n=1 Tax=Cyclobacterium sp. TaxID=1966343 RepID=UPI0039705811